MLFNSKGNKILSQSCKYKTIFSFAFTNTFWKCLSIMNLSDEVNSTDRSCAEDIDCLFFCLN